LDYGRRNGVTIHEAQLNEARRLTKIAQEQVARVRRGQKELRIGNETKASGRGRNGVPNMMGKSGVDYARCVSDPMNSPSAKGIAQGNIAATEKSFTAQTTYSFNRVISATASTTEWGFFPGHGILSDVDRVSNHCQKALIGSGATPYAIGPMTSTGNPACIGYSFSGAVDSAVANLNVAGTAPIQADEDLPFSALDGESEHTRWRLIGLGVKFFNVTKGGDRGGRLSYVQPNNPFAASTIKEFEKFAPLFQETMECNSDEGFEIVWIPRTSDLGYCHSAITGNQESKEAGLRIWYTNETGVTQQVRLDVVAHWEISGSELGLLSSPSVHHANGEDLVTKSVEGLRQVGFTGGGVANALLHTSKQLLGLESSDALVPQHEVSPKVPGAGASIAGLLKGITSVAALL